MARMSQQTPTDGPARPRVLSGIQPTSDSFHFGNYLGATRQWVDLQDTHQPFFFIADMHAIEPGPEPKQLRERRFAELPVAVFRNCQPSLVCRVPHDLLHGRGCMLINPNKCRT